MSVNYDVVPLMLMSLLRWSKLGAVAVIVLELLGGWGWTRSARSSAAWLL